MFITSFCVLLLQKYTNEEAVLRLLKDGQEVTGSVKLAAPVKLIPFHIKGQPPRWGEAPSGSLQPS
jgi:hypothetical protein